MWVEAPGRTESGRPGAARTRYPDDTASKPYLKGSWVVISGVLSRVTTWESENLPLQGFYPLINVP